MSEETHGEYEDDDLRAEAEEATKDIDVFESGHSNEGEAEEFASKIIKRAASLKAVKINRERFGDIIVRACLNTRSLCLKTTFRRQQNNRNMTSLHVLLHNLT